MKNCGHEFTGHRGRLNILPSAVVFLLGALMFAGIPNARAALVSTNEAGVDTIYSQTSFGTTPVDISFNPTATLSNGSLLNITTEAALNELFSFNGGTSTDVISIYFVDTLDWCSGFNTAIVGCASLGGNDIAVESGSAAGIFGAELIAHEIGHSLNLDHPVPDAPSNLMFASLNGNTELTDSQATAILGSSFIQRDGSFRFVSVTPVLVTPLPPAMIMFVSAILVLFGVHRRKKALI